MKKILSVLIVLAAMVVLWSFFQPWAAVGTSATKLSKYLTNATAGTFGLKETPAAGELVKDVEKVQDVLGAIGDIGVETVVRGYEIPGLVNNKTSKTALSLVRVMFKDVRDIGKESYLVYLAPGLAAILVFLAVIGMKNKLAVVVVFILSGASSLTMLYNVLTADMSGLPVSIVIENGLWFTMFGFLFIFIVSFVGLFADRGKKWF